MPPNGLSVPWSEPEVAYLRELSAQGLTALPVARAINDAFHGGRAVRSTHAIRQKRAGLGVGVHPAPAPAQEPAAPLPPAPEPVPPPDPIEVEQRRRQRLRELREEREAVQAVAGERSLRDMLERLVRATAQTFDPPPAYRPPPVASGSVRETVVQMLSDWHADEKVSAEAMRGFNEYNDTIFRARIRRVVESHLSIKQRMEAGGGWTFERLVLGLNGDFISGTIHELEKHSDHENVIWAVYNTGMVLAEAIADLAAAYPAVEIFCTSGNHGRLPDARRVQQKEPTRNWDTLIYLFAREHLRLLPSLTWYIPNSYSVAWDIYGWRFLQTHGHDVKSWNSIPWYGLNRLVSNINALEAGRGTPIHYWTFAHFHEHSSLPHASGESFINGSLIGGSEFTLNGLGKVGRPTQWMLCVHPEHGVTSRWPLFAEAPMAAPRMAG